MSNGQNRNSITIRGARQHNLKNINLTIPRDKLVVITGLSGSGKSSLAFDTLYAEGQRRYIESLSSYARQFLGQMQKPDVDFIDGLSPAISIAQKTGGHNPRSTVGTVTEIHDYMRLLYARIGLAHCPSCKIPIKKTHASEIIERIRKYPEGTKLKILAPVIKDKKGEHRNIFQNLVRDGYVRARIDGIETEITSETSLAKTRKHTIEVVVDRLVIKDGLGSRIGDSVETALKLGEGVVIIEVVGAGEIVFSEKYSCPECGFSMPEIEPRSFSFNSPHGACPSCAGLGSRMVIDRSSLILDPSKSIREGGLAEFGGQGEFFYQALENVARHYGFDLDTPIKDLNEEQLDILLYGSGSEYIDFNFNSSRGSEFKFSRPFEGIIPSLERRLAQTQSEAVKVEIMSLMSTVKCSECNGRRLKPEILAVTVGGASIADLSCLSIKKLKEFFSSLTLTEREKTIAKDILKEINARLDFLIHVGLDYLSLDRMASTLSGGESARIKLACQIGSGLMGVLYILDEPSIGLHQRDNERLISTLKHLRDIGNSVIVVEHDEQTIREADFVVDMGPGAGEHGGEIVYAGPPSGLGDCEKSLTGKYLSGKISIPVPQIRREGNGKKLIIKRAAENNLKSIDVEIPLGTFTCITGVSGSGKSTLINEVLYKNLMKHFFKTRMRTGRCDGITGLENIDRVIFIDQSPIGRTPRSNPATYTGVFAPIRDLFTLTPEARKRGYKAGRFSFNVRGGRCEACEGDGIIKIEMHFLPDVYVVCEACKGKRYNNETLEIKYRGLDISQVLELTASEALHFFEHIPAIKNKLQTLVDVGLGYIKLGQSATTLSGGEAQRVKLACELSKRPTGMTLYLLDEPTTGLHFADIHKLLSVLSRFVDAGNTVVVIEHNLEVIKVADHIIDLGPEGGEMGGQIVATGKPEEIILNPASYTGKFLKNVLQSSSQPLSKIKENLYVH